MTQAVRQHSKSLSLDALFSEARNAIAVQEMEVRHYQSEPSRAVRNRKETAATAARRALEQVIALRFDEASVRDAQRMLAEWREFNETSEQLTTLITNGDPTATAFDRLHATPAFFTLQQDVDRVTLAHHTAAQAEAGELRKDQIRLLIGTSVGYGFGLLLVSLIGWMILGDQRRLVQHAGESEHRALHDALTGLPNRVMFRQRLHSKPDAVDGPIGVMIVDLNGFKAVNDSMGHAAGDQLLVEAGRRLAASLRDEDLVARLGGDEFAVIIENPSDADEVREVAERLIAVMREPFHLDSGPANVSGSVGIAIGPRDSNVEDLVRHADAAMYRAKIRGGGTAVFHGAKEPAPFVG